MWYVQGQLSYYMVFLSNTAKEFVWILAELDFCRNLPYNFEASLKRTIELLESNCWMMWELLEFNYKFSFMFNKNIKLVDSSNRNFKHYSWSDWIRARLAFRMVHLLMLLCDQNAKLAVCVCVWVCVCGACGCVRVLCMCVCVCVALSCRSLRLEMRLK